MVFISEKSDVFELREVPVFAAPVTLAITLGMFAAAVRMLSSSEMIGGALFFFLAGLVGVYVVLKFLRMRRCVFDRVKGTLVVHNRFVTGKTTIRHQLTNDAYAEVVIRDDDGDTFAPELVLSEESVLLADELGLVTSSRIVIALNAWLSKSIDASCTT